MKSYLIIQREKIPVYVLYPIPGKACITDKPNVLNMRNNRKKG